jgi:membrane protein implicated in regulation of membrane protease activity
MEISSEFLSPEVIWFLLGAALLLLELLIPGLILLFFGIGAWITAVCIWAFDLSLNQQLLIFCISSLGSLFALRQGIRKKYMDISSDGNEQLSDEYIGNNAITLTSISPEKEGKIEYNGSHWEAISKVSIPPNKTVRIVGKKSIKFIVEPLTI